MSSHREAPNISKDPVADNTYTYAFVRPRFHRHGHHPGELHPAGSTAGGPNFYEFGDDVLCEIHISNAGTADSDVTYRFQFSTKIADPSIFLHNTGAIESLGSANWNVKQFYSVKKVTKSATTTLLAVQHRPPVDAELFGAGEGGHPQPSFGAKGLRGLTGRGLLRRPRCRSAAAITAAEVVVLIAALLARRGPSTPVHHALGLHPGLSQPPPLFPTTQPPTTPGHVPAGVRRRRCLFTRRRRRRDDASRLAHLCHRCLDHDHRPRAERRPHASVITPDLRRNPEAGWFQWGPKPGEVGAAVIVGHIDSTTGAGGLLPPGVVEGRHTVQGGAANCQTVTS